MLNVVNSGLLSIIKDNIQDPFLILDRTGKIHFSNNNTQIIFDKLYSDSNIFDFIEPEFQTDFKKLISELLYEKKTLITTCTLKFIGIENVYKYKVILNYYFEDDEDYIFITFAEIKNKYDSQDIFKLTKVEQPEDILEDDILNTLKELKEIYPFTLLEKENYKINLNKLEYPIWIKDLEGRFIVVNNSFARLLYITTEQLENKLEIDFLPGHLKSFHIFLFNHIITTTNIILLEGYPLKGIAKLEKYILIEVPLLNEQNKVMAVAGIYKKKIENQENLLMEQLNTEKNTILNLIHKNPEPVFLYNKEDLTFLDVNSSALKMYGYTKDDFLKLDLTDLYSSEDIQIILEEDNAKEGTFYGPYKHRKKDGTYLTVELSKINIRINNKEVVVCYIKNINSNNGHDNKFISVLKDNVFESILIADEFGFISDCNTSFIESFGFNLEEIKNNNLVSLSFSDDDRSKLSNLIQSNSSNAILITLKNKNHEGIKVKIKISSLEILNNKSIILFINKVEEENSLMPKVEVNEDNSSTNKDMLSTVFHDILTPINSIIGFAKELSDSMENLSTEQKEAVDIIEQSRVDLMNRMNNIQDFYSVESSENVNVTSFKSVTFLEELQNSLQAIEKSTQNKVVLGKISSSLILNTDKEKLNSLVLITLKIIASILKDSKIVFTISSNGLYSISYKLVNSTTTQKLCENFQYIFNNEIEKRTLNISRFNGKFLGLLLKRLQGRYVSKEENDSIIISFEIPDLQQSIKIDEEVLMEKSNITEIKEEIIFQPELEKPISPIYHLKCLYIEDQIDSQIYFKSQLKELKEIDYANSLEDAQPLLVNKKYDFIVVDINLQGEYNGLDALRYIHSIPEYKNTPVIAVTAYLSPGDREKYIQTGFTDFISKPIYKDKITDILKKII